MIYLFKLSCVEKTVVVCCVLPALESSLPVLRGGLVHCERTAECPGCAVARRAPLASHCVGISAQSLLRHGPCQTGSVASLLSIVSSLLTPQVASLSSDQPADISRLQ